MFDREMEEDGLKDYAAANGIGIDHILSIGTGFILLTNRYLNGIPEDSRIRTDGRFLKETAINERRLQRFVHST